MTITKINEINIENIDKIYSTKMDTIGLFYGQSLEETVIVLTYKGYTFGGYNNAVLNDCADYDPSLNTEGNTMSYISDDG